jgi:S-adenosylmethionine:tRNA ribosyltransferase-isomerase
MKKPNDSIQSFDYELTEKRIAKFPLMDRSASKLLQFKKGIISDHQFHELPDLMPENSLLVFNNTKVIHARINFQTQSGAAIEIFCLEPARNISPQEALQQTEKSTWNCLIGNNRKWKSGDLGRIIKINNQEIKLSVERKKKKRRLLCSRIFMDRFTTICGNY